jgi:hypothetical protein
MCFDVSVIQIYSITGGIPVSDCPTCGWPESDVYEVLSRHFTSEGVVTYSRCVCGEIQVRLRPYASDPAL